MTSPLTALREAGIEVVLHEHPPIRGEADLPLTGLDWTAAVKTLAFELADGRLALVGIPGPARARFGEIARALGVSRSQLRPASEDRLASVGMEPGGVSPICDRPGVVVALDEAALALGRIYCGSGRPTATLELDAAVILQVAPDSVVAVLSQP